MSLKQFVNQIAVLLPKIMRLFVKRQASTLFKENLTLPQFLVLEYLYNEKKAIMSKIAEVLSVSAPAATGIVDNLVKNGYLKREYDQNNRRVVFIKLTAKGKRIIGRVIKNREALIKETFGRLKERERKEYLNIMNKIYKTLLEKQKN